MNRVPQLRHFEIEKQKHENLELIVSSISRSASSQKRIPTHSDFGITTKQAK